MGLNQTEKVTSRRYSIFNVRKIKKKVISVDLKYFIYRVKSFFLSFLIVVISAFNAEIVAQCPADVLQGQNLVQNGDFSGGTSDWTFTEDSDGDPSSVDGYILFNPPVTQNFSQPGFINVGDDPTVFNNAFGTFGDHTDGTGNMMMVDGICTVGAKLWTQSGISVSANTTYYFSVWVHALQDGNDPPGTLQFEIEAGGTTYNPTPSAITAPVNLADGWVQFEATWVSPAGLAPGTLANISIENTTTTGCGTDVDFAIDDISFIPGCSYADATTTISPDLGPDQTICGKGGGAIVLDVTDEGINDVAANEIWWSDGVGDGTGGAGSGQFTRSITPDPSSLPLTISVCTKVSGGCTKTDVITISGDYQITVPDVNLCDPASVTLDAGFTGIDVTYQWSKEQNGTAGWQADDEVNGAGSQTFFVNEPGTYKVEVNDPACGIREDEIIITTSAPEPINDTFCPPQNVTLYVTPNNDGKYKWWDDPVATDPSNLIQTGGDSYTFSATNTFDYIFYVDDTATFASNIAPEYNTGTFTTPTSYGNIGVNFQALSPFSITEVTLVPFVYSMPGQVSVTFELYDIDNAQVIGNYSTVPVNANATQQGTGPFNDAYTVVFSTPVEIPAAGNYSLKPTSGSQLPIFDGATWSGYSLPGVIELTGNTADPGKASFFPGFFNWKISAGTQCARVPVIATYYCPPCSQPTVIDFIPDADTLRLCPDKDISIAASFTAPDTSVNGGFYYTWYKDGSVYTAASTGLTPPSLDLTVLSATDAATYTLRVEDGNIEDPGCYLERDIVIEVPQTLPGSIGTDHAICLGEDASELTSLTDASGGYGTIEYQWQYNDGLNWVDLAGANGVNYSPGAISLSTEYRRAAFWGTCDSVFTTSVTVTVNPVPVVTANNDTTICAGQSVNLQASGADTYLWDNGLGAGANHAVTPAATSTYTVIGSFSTGCADTTEIVVTVNPLPTASISGGGSICNGDNATISFTLTGTGPFTVNYTDAGGVAQSPSSATGNYSFTTSVDGTYTLTGVQDANACSNTATGSVNVSTVPDLAVTSPVATCDFANAEFTVTFDVSGGDGTYSVNGENGGSFTGNTFTSNPVSGNGSTNYSFSVSDGSGCPANTNVAVAGTQNCACPVVGILDATPQEICADQTSVDFVVNLTGAVATPYSIEITAPDGTVLPYNNLVDGNNTVTINNLQSGTYILTKASDASCSGSASGSVVLTVNPLPTASISGGGDICNGDNATISFALTGTGPFTINYTDAGGVVQSPISSTLNYDFTTAIDGTYTLTGIEDANGCTNTATGSVAVATTPALNITSPAATCDFGNAEFSVTFDISGGDGAYTVTGENGGAVVGNTFTSNAVSGSGATNYSFSVSDGSGCPANTNVVVAGSQNCSCPVVGSLDSTPLEVCADETSVDFVVNLTGALVTPYSIEITAPDGTVLPFNNLVDGNNTITINNLQSGTYTLTQASDASCTGSASGSLVLTINSLPTAVISGGGNICNGDNATIAITLTGTAPFSISYTDAGGITQNPTSSLNTYSFNTSIDGNYTLTGIQDAKGCVNTAAGQVTVVTTPVLSVTAPAATCDFGNSEFSVNFDISGGDGVYSVSGETGGNISAGTFTSNPVTGSGATNYTYTVSDGSGCPANTNVAVSGTQNCSCPVVGTLDSTPLEICADQNSVDFTVNLSGAIVSPYSIEITAPDGAILSYSNLLDGNNTITINDIQAGTYTLSKVADASCEGNATGSVFLTVYQLPIASISGSANICNDGTSTTPVEISVTGGQAPYAVVYSVDGGTGQNLNITTTPFTYSTNAFGNHQLVSVSDNRGCSALPSGLTGSALITGDELPTIASAGSPANTCIEEYQLSGNTPLVGTGVWTDDKGLIYDDPTLSNATASGIGSGETVTFTWTISNGACPPSSSSVAISRIGSLVAPDLGNDTTICSSVTSLTLVSDVSGGNWSSDGTATFTQTLNNAVVSNLEVGDNRFVYTIDDGFCPPLSDDIIVKVDQALPQPAISPDKVKICYDQYVLPAPSPQVLPGVGVWSVSEGQGNLVQPSDPETTINGLNSPGITTLLWTVQSGVCPPKSDTLVIEVPEPVKEPQIFIDGGAYSMENITNGVVDLCRNTSYNLSTSTPGTGELLLWSTVSGNAVQKPTGSSTSIVMNAAGASVFSLTVTNNTSGCPSKNAQVNLNVINPPAQPGIISGPNNAICAGTGNHTYSINSLPGATSYSWEIISGTGLSIQAPDSGAGITEVKLDVADPSTSGTLRVKAWNACGVSPSRTIGVTVSPLLAPMVSITGKDTICEDEPIEFISDLSSETTGPQFAWYHNGELVSPGGTSSKLILSDVADKDSIRLEVRSNYACTIVNPVSSNTIYMTVKPLVEVDVDIEADQDFPVCEGELVTFTALPVNPGTSPVYSWTASNGTPASGNGPVFSTTINASSLVSVRMISDEACLAGSNTAISLEDVKAIQNEAVSTTILAPDPTCEGENVTSPFVALSNGVGVDASYQWTLDGQNVGNGEGFYVPPVELSPGSYTIGVTVVTDLECVLNTSDNDVAMHTVNPQPMVEIDGPQIICPEATVTLTGSPSTGNYSYKWLNGLIEIPGETSSTLNVSQSGLYYLQVTDNVNLCKSQSIQGYSVTSISQEPLEISGDPDLIKCEGESINLTVNPAGNIMVWKKDEQLIQSGQTITVDEEGTYEVIWTYIAGSQQCTDSAEAFVEERIPPKPVINESSGLLCSGEEYVLTATPESGGDILWMRNGIIVPDSTGNRFTAIKGGQYIAVEKNQHCSGLSNPVDVTIEAKPVANAGTDQYVPARQPVILSSSESINAFSFQWSSLNYYGDYRSLNETDIAVLPESNKTYFIVTAYSSSGQCTDSDTVLVTTELDIRPWNSFSPNNDGTYDFWIVENLINYPNADIEIFNRWGNLVWRSKGYDKPWKGENFRNGQLLPVATYYYVIYPNGGYIKEPLTGPVTIVK